MPEIPYHNTCELRWISTTPDRYLSSRIRSYGLNVQLESTKIYLGSVRVRRRRRNVRSTTQSPDFEAHDLEFGRLALSSTTYPGFTTQDVVIERHALRTASFKERRRQVQASLTILPILLRPVKRSVKSLARKRNFSYPPPNETESFSHSAT